MIETDMSSRLESVIISPAVAIADAMVQLDRAGTGTLLLSEGDRKLWGILTDGDLRRAILRGVSFHDPCGPIATRDPLVVSPEMAQSEVLRVMNERDVDQLPIVDPTTGSLMGLFLRRDLITEDQLPVSAVIMAGGFGTRLLPLTGDTPKPMLPVGDRPLLEQTIRRLQRAGISRVHLTTHHLASRISEHFGDGHDFGVAIRYVPEDRPLGTAGGLRLMEETTEPLLVINGDILTGIDFRALLAYHRKNEADVTVGVRRYEMQVPYGVVECDGAKLLRIREKPELSFLVNAGIYLLEPSVQRFIPEGQRFDMTDLIQRLVEGGRPVVSYPIVEYWLDVGRPADYQKAQDDVRDGRIA